MRNASHSLAPALSPFFDFLSREALHTDLSAMVQGVCHLDRLPPVSAALSLRCDPVDGVHAYPSRDDYVTTTLRGHPYVISKA